MRQSLLVVVGVLAVCAWASADDDFRVRLVEHRVRSGFTEVYGTVNVAYGRGLMNPEHPVTSPFDMSKPPIHEINLVARFDHPITVTTEPRTSAPIDMFGVNRADPGRGRLGPRDFGSVTMEGPWGPSNVFRRVETDEIRVVPRATADWSNDTHSRPPRAAWPGQTSVSKKWSK